MTNPLRKHANSMFASRGCDMDLAMAYATEVLFASSTDKAAVMTALMVVVNTAANAFDQAMGPSPEKLAVEDMVRQIIQRELEQNTGNFDQRISDWFDSNVDIDDKINDWMSNNFDISDYSVDDVISDWMGSNLEDKINDLDLVVRVK